MDGVGILAAPDRQRTVPLVQHLPGTATVLEANRDFFGGTPRIERVVLKFGGRTS